MDDANKSPPRTPTASSAPYSQTPSRSPTDFKRRIAHLFAAPSADDGDGNVDHDNSLDDDNTPSARRSYTMGLLDHVNSAVSGAKSAVGGSGHHSTPSSGSAGGGSSNAGSKDEQGPPSGAAADDTEELDEESGNILLSLIGQLRIGMDLSKVTLPTFCLEPRSMLERITDFMSHPDLIFGAGKQDDAAERFLAVTRYYLSGWHIKPKGVKKP